MESDQEVVRRSRLEYETKRNCALEDASNAAFAGLCLYAGFKIFTGIFSLASKAVRYTQSLIEKEKIEQEKKKRAISNMSNQIIKTNPKAAHMIASGVFDGLDAVLKS